MKSVIKGAGYILCHVPDMVLHNGTTQTTEMIVNPEGDYLKELPSHIRSWEDVLQYWPNQVYIGNKTPDELAAIPQPFYQTPCDVTERYGHFGQMMPQEEFLLLMQAADVFDLVLLDKNFVAANKPAFAANPMIDESIVARIKDALPFPLNMLYPLTVKEKPAPLPAENKDAGTEAAVNTGSAGPDTTAAGGN